MMRILGKYGVIPVILRATTWRCHITPGGLSYCITEHDADGMCFRITIAPPMVLEGNCCI